MRLRTREESAQRSEHTNHDPLRNHYFLIVIPASVAACVPTVVLPNSKHTPTRSSFSTQSQTDTAYGAGDAHWSTMFVLPNAKQLCDPSQRQVSVARDQLNENDFDSDVNSTSRFPISPTLLSHLSQYAYMSIAAFIHPRMWAAQITSTFINIRPRPKYVRWMSYDQCDQELKAWSTISVCPCALTCLTCNDTIRRGTWHRCSLFYRRPDIDSPELEWDRNSPRPDLNSR